MNIFGYEYAVKVTFGETVDEHNQGTLTIVGDWEDLLRIANHFECHDIVAHEIDFDFVSDTQCSTTYLISQKCINNLFLSYHRYAGFKYKRA